MKNRILLFFALILVSTCVYSQKSNKIDYQSQTYDLVFDRPNCILSVIPMDELPRIKSLTIRGELGKDDISIIFDKCTSLEYLDLKNTNIKEFKITDFSKVSELKIFKMPSHIYSLQVPIPAQVNDFGDLFKDCYNLESVELPAELVYLKCNLFVNCPKITSIIIPAKVKELVIFIQKCPSLAIVDLSLCSNISQNSMGWRAYMLKFQNCPNIGIIKYQSGKTYGFSRNGEPQGVSYFFSSNECRVSYYENSKLFFKGEAYNDKNNPVKNCSIYCPESMMTHFYVEFNQYNNQIVGLSVTEMEAMQKKQQKNLIEQQQERLRLQQERQEKEQQERIRQETERLERKKREAKERERKTDSIVKLNKLKSNYSGCRFLFNTEKEFVSCITRKRQSEIENKINNLIDQKMDEMSTLVITGAEFKDNSITRTTIIELCDIPNTMSSTSSTIANYAENKIQEFVTTRNKLNKAYNKAKKKDPSIVYSDFLLSYIKEKTGS